MLHLVTATLKDGTVLETQFTDRETAEAERRWIERLRRRVWWPAVSWQTTSGRNWVFAPAEVVGELEIREAQSAPAVTG